jgi:RNA polymerase sigma factor (sigma-70 family)
MDAVSAKQLYEQYGFLIYRTCLRILHSEEDAQDALQEVFVKLLEHFSAIKDPERVVPWIFTAAKNHCFNLLRYRKKFDSSAIIDEVRSAENFENQIEAREIINRTMRHHGKKVRDAVYFSYVEQFDQREIHKLTGQSPATIRRNLSRFKKSLASIGKKLAINNGNS